MTEKPKLLIIGHGRHGKDTACDILRDSYGFQFRSSSDFCAEHVIFPVLRDRYGYMSIEECYQDRHSHRSEWYDLISEYCQEDASRLGREIFGEYDIYCGLRNRREYEAMRLEGIFDYCVWVDRSEHLPPEDSSSMTLSKEQADYVIDNNGSLEELTERVDDFISFASYRYPLGL